MLVLSRKRDESICIGDEVEIMVVDIRGDKVRLGCQAPASMPVHRREVFDAIQRNEPPKHRGESPVEGAVVTPVPRGLLFILLSDLKSRRNKVSFTETKELCDDVIRRLEAMLAKAV